MEKHNRLGRSARIDLGFAADTFGNGVAHARVVEGERERLLRVPFSVKPLPALLGRDVAYAALTVVAGEVREAGVTHPHFVVDDARLGLDLESRRALPSALSLPYVRLRCALNRFRAATVSRAAGQTEQLAEQARCEVGLLVAA